MCPESFGDVRFVLGALLEGRMCSLIPILVYISLIIGRRGLDVKTTYGKSCAPNFWVGSNLTFDRSFKVECGLDTYNDLYLPFYWSHLIVWHRGLGCQDNLQESICPNSCGGVRFEL